MICIPVIKKKPNPNPFYDRKEIKMSVQIYFVLVESR